MSTGIIKTIQKVSLEAIKRHALQVRFGKVESTSPLKIKVGDTLTLTEEFVVLDAPVDDGEDVIVIQYSNGNKYLVLSTVEKIYKSSTSYGGVVNKNDNTNNK